MNMNIKYTRIHYTYIKIILYVYIWPHPPKYSPSRSYRLAKTNSQSSIAFRLCINTQMHVCVYVHVVLLYYYPIYSTLSICLPHYRVAKRQASIDAL